MPLPLPWALGPTPHQAPCSRGPGVLSCRLVRGLASENVRWAESVQTFQEQGKTLCGDVLLISAFVSYVGYFTKKYRAELVDRHWVPYLNKLKVKGTATTQAAPWACVAPWPWAGQAAESAVCSTGAHPRHAGAGSPEPPDGRRGRGDVEQPGAAQ